MASAADVMKGIQKDYGDAVASSGQTEFEDVERIPTGIFPLDLAIGGGIPMGRCSIIYGPESSNKTNIALLTIKQAQIKYPDKLAVFVDAEQAYDPKWAETLGVDLNRLIVLYPEYAEQAVNMIEGFLHADDVSILVLDSIAALVVANEVNSDASKMIVGGASMMVGKLFKKATVSFAKMRNAGRKPPAFLGINQVRFKIGVMFGDPETMPGGNGPKFASSMTIRVYGKNVMDTKIHGTLPAYKDTSVILKKWKVPVLQAKAEFKMLMVPHNGEPPGTINDWNTLFAYMKELEYIEKTKGGWSFNGKTYPTTADVRALIYGDPSLLQELKDTLIQEMAQRITVLAEEDPDAGLDPDE